MVFCNHKFVDNKHCLKCGWTPKASDYPKPPSDTIKLLGREVARKINAFHMGQLAGRVELAFEKRLGNRPAFRLRSRLRNYGVWCEVEFRCDLQEIIFEPIGDKSPAWCFRWRFSELTLRHEHLGNLGQRMAQEAETEAKKRGVRMDVLRMLEWSVWTAPIHIPHNFRCAQ